MRVDTEEKSMSYQNNGFDYDAYARRDGRMSASNQRRYSQLQRPSVEELAQYSAANYTSRKKRTSGPSLPDGIDRKFVIIAVVAAIVLLLVVPGALLAVSAKNVADDAKLLVNQGSALVNQIQAGDVEGAQRTAKNLDSVAKQLDGNVNSFLWKPAVLIPVYGEDIRSVRKLAHVVSQLSEDVLIPLTESLPTDGSARPFVDGAFNIPFLQAVLQPIANAQGAIEDCTRRVNALPDAHLGQLQEPMSQVKSIMGALDEVSQYAGDLSQAIPSLLGADEPRTYLLVAFGESELRSTGGFPGSTGLLTVDNGKLIVGEMDAPALRAIGEGEEFLPLTYEEEIMFGQRAGGYFYDAGYNPHFPRAAEIMKSIWDARGREPIDGMICLDPVFLQRVIALTGAVTTSDGVAVDGTNAAEMLLKDAYIMYSSDVFEEEAAQSEEGLTAQKLAENKQNAFFTEVASLALEAFFENISSVNMLTAVQVLGESIADKRFYMWMVDPGVQAIIERLDAACAMSFSAADPELGVYLATTVATKGNWFVKSQTDVVPGTKNADGSTSYSVTTKIWNFMTPEEAETLPSTLINPTEYTNDKIRTKGDMILDVYLFAPMGGSITDLQAQGDFAPDDMFDDVGVWYTRPGIGAMINASYNGREAWYGVTMLGPQQTTTFTYTVTTSPEAIGSLTVDTTPLGSE